MYLIHLCEKTEREKEYILKRRKKKYLQKSFLFQERKERRNIPSKDHHSDSAYYQLQFPC